METNLLLSMETALSFASYGSKKYRPAKTVNIRKTRKYFFITLIFIGKKCCFRYTRLPLLRLGNYDLKQEDGKGDKRWLAAAEEALSAQPPPEPVVNASLDAVDSDDAATETSEADNAPARPVAQSMPVVKKADDSLASRVLQRLSNKRPLADLFEHSSEWDGGAQLAQMAGDFERRLSTNLAMYTTEALFTDRVYYEIPEAYQRFLFGGAAPRPDRSPALAVTRTPAREEYAHAVIAANDSALDLKFFNFEPALVQASLRTWRLRPGRYQWTVVETKQQGEVQIDGPRRYVTIPLAPGRELTVTIRRR